jgi:transposase
LRFILTAGQEGDMTQAEALIEDLPGEHLLADKAYDGDRFRNTIATRGMIAVIPPNRSRSIAIDYDKELYKERHLVETRSSTSDVSPRATTRPSAPSSPCYACVAP